MADTIRSPIPDGHLRAIGRVTVDFAQMEQEIAYIVWTLLRVEHKIGQVITAEISIRQMIGMASSLAKEQITDVNKATAFEDLLSEASNLEAERNRIVHSFYAVDEHDNVARLKFTAKKGKGWKFDSEHVNAATLEAFADRIAGLSLKLVQFGSGINPATT